MSDDPLNFVLVTQPARVIFAAGSVARLAAEVDLLGAKRALVLCTPNQRAQAELAATALAGAGAGVFDGAQMHVPIEVARRARAHAASVGADCIVAIGGGSTIGLGKAIALESAVPVIAVPTTYAGSEMTPIYGITEDSRKTTERDLRVLPRTVIYDPELTLGLPVALSMTSGINAIAHAAEGLYARDGNPIIALMAEEGIRALAAGLPRVRQDPRDLSARADCLYGAWLCGTVLGQVGMALHHKLCHALGGGFDLPHAETHTVLLPHVLAFNAPAAPAAVARVARALGVQDAASGLSELARRLGAPVALRELGLTRADLPRAVDLALANPYWNPRPLERDAIARLIERAWEGAPPTDSRGG